MLVLDGFQFFDDEQKFLKVYEYDLEHEQNKKLTASSVVTYLLMRSLCDEAGLINEADLNLKSVCEKINLPYSSIHNGYHRLFEIGLLSIARIGERTFIQLPIVASHVPNIDDGEVSSYFRIPKTIFKSDFLKAFIKARDVRGLLGMFDLLNGLYREYSRNMKLPLEKRKKNTSLKRKKATLIKLLKQSKYAFKNWIKRVLQGKDSLIEIKNEQDGLYELKLAEQAFTERKQDTAFEQLNASVRNTLSSILKSSSVIYTTKELQDMQYACQQELTEPCYRAILFNDQSENLVKMIVPEILNATISQLEKVDTRVIGAYFRKTLRIQIRHIMREETVLRKIIANSYKSEGSSVPTQYN